MLRSSLQVIRDEHSTLAAMLRSLVLMVERGPRDAPEQYFDVVRAMLFYIDEFPERLHHPKETKLLFPPLLKKAPDLAETIARLEKDHAVSELAVRELQHDLLAWELMGDARRPRFEAAAKKYLDAYLAHMHVEETEILPVAEKLLSEEDWRMLDAAFASNTDPMNGKSPRDPVYDRLFTRIVMRAPAPIGVGTAD